MRNFRRDHPPPAQGRRSGSLTAVPARDQPPPTPGIPKAQCTSSSLFLVMAACTLGRPCRQILVFRFVSPPMTRTEHRDTNHSAARQPASKSVKLAHLACERHATHSGARHERDNVLLVEIISDDRRHHQQGSHDDQRDCDRGFHSPWIMVEKQMAVECSDDLQCSGLSVLQKISSLRLCAVASLR